MKYGFLIAFAALALISLGYGLISTERSQGKPVIYWVTDNNPARVEQVKLFEAWVKKHYDRDVDLQVDTANSDNSKKLIQGVSGVGDDIMDMDWPSVQLFNAVGILQNLTVPAEKLGFGPDHTYKAVVPLLTSGGHQVAFPCNVYVAMYWINKATFKKYGVPVPPRRWSFDEFERLGKQFVKAANPPGRPHNVFFAMAVDPDIMRRSLGVDVFNETLSACALDDPRTIATFNLIRKWMYVDQIIPSSAEIDSFSVQPGYGGASTQLFNSGNIGMFIMGRYALIQFRQFGSLQLSVSEPPNGGFANTSIATRCAGVYAGSDHTDLADLFLAFLASKDYNMQIVRDADALPPNPVYTKTEEFLRPPAHPNEWGCHEAFSDAAQNIAIPPAISPFVLPSTALRIESQAYAACVTSGRLSAADAVRQETQQINNEIQRSLQEDPSLRPAYEQALQRQKKIEQYRAEGKKVPLAWISNPFYRAYYQFKGWAE